MTTHPPTLEEWRRLYEAAVRVKTLAPWAWMQEDDLFGVQNPETDDLGFVSVMGMAGEHYAVGVYLGAEGLYRFWMFQQAAPLVEPMELLQIPQLQASFEDRDQLEEADRVTIKRLGLKFRGRNAWPMFRDFHPGLAPWFVDGAQARFLTQALEQLLHIAPRFKADPNLLACDDDQSYLVRVPKQRQVTVVWSDQVKPVPPPPLAPIDVVMDFELLAAVKRLPKRRPPVEVDCFLLPTRIGEKGQRPYYPYMLLVVDTQADLILGTELLQPAPSVDAMWGRVPLTLVQQLASTGVIPREVRVRSPLLVALLQGVADELGFQVKQSFELPSLDAARAELDTFLRR